MSKTYKVGLIGCGGIAKAAHIPAYLLEKRAEVVAVCDIRPERAEFARSKFFKNAKTYTDYKELLKNEEVDYVDICTPNYLHSIIAVDALNAGKHVLCEKPDAVSVEEALKMKAAADANGKRLMVIRNNRYMDSSKKVKALADEGYFGDFYAGRCGWVRRRGIPGKGGWFTTKEQSGGGPLIDLGVHMIDLAIYFMGNPKPVAVSGNTFCKFANADDSDSVHSKFGDRVEGGTFDVEDLAMGFIRFDNGAVLQIEFSWASNIKKEYRFVELRGEKAGVSWTDGIAELHYEKNGKMKNEKVKANIVKLPHKENISHFIDVLNGEADPIFVPEQGIDMIKILSAIYESAKTGREVIL
ncbi:MAG: Gfo/Idh/MocA family oxidoreductase [Clostridia bacterium]|nr:Gfo/Idh/MocA family oxidoreductase [Clostridia bacterium]